MDLKEFKYKHITKLPWFATIIWTVILAWLFRSFPVNSFLDLFVRLFLFGVSWWFLFQFLDERAARYRRKILFQTPELKSAYIANKLAEWESESD
jgi:hypothetical protein